MKNTFKLTLLSITLVSFTVQSSAFITEEFTTEPPAIVTNKMIEIPEKEQRAEHTLLKKGLDAFLKREFFDALTHFTKALGDYGSPLGHLYASALETDPQTKARYYLIAQKAEEFGALPTGTVKTHNMWIKQFFENLKKSPA